MRSQTLSARSSTLLLILGIAAATLGCASTQPVAGYKMVPPAEMGAYALSAQPYEGLDAPATGQSTAEWTSQWLSGPVSTLVTPDEAERFRELRTDVEREEFIRLFWHRRNPEPDQDYNESLAEFRRRVEVANAAFGSADGPGWQTMFGRTMIVLGFPTIVRVGDEKGPKATHTEAVRAKGGERVYWQYGLLPEDLAGTSLAGARLWSAEGIGAVRASHQDVNDYFITFAYIGGGWTLGCGLGWPGVRPDSWGGVRFYNGSSRAGGSFGGMSGGVAAAGETLSDIDGSGGVAVPGRTGGFRAGQGVNGRIGPGCGDVFAAAINRWLFNTVYYP